MVLAETKETIEDIAAEAQAEIASGQRTCRVNAQDDTYITHRLPRAKTERARPAMFCCFDAGGRLRHFPDFVQNETC